MVRAAPRPQRRQLPREAGGSGRGLRGPSGSGKSTLIRCINSLEPIQKGTLIVERDHPGDGKTDITKLRAEIGFVFQQFNLYPHLTTLKNITLGPIKVKRSTKKRPRTWPCRSSSGWV